MKNFFAALGLISLITVAVLIGLSCTDLSSGNITYSGERIGLIHISGVISAADSQMSPFIESAASSEKVVEQIDEARKDKNIKALVIRVNSPGGSAAASQEIYTAIRNYRQAGKKVIVSMGDVAASGGYYVSAPADIIYANPATLTGSIGVIMQVMNYEGLFQKLGLTDVTLKAGKFKDIGNPTRPMTDEEKQILQNMLTEVHGQFKTAVMEGRGMTQAQIDKIATGEIWSGRQAKEIGLVDELGGLKDALDRAAKDSGLNVENYVVSPLGEGNIIDEIMKSFKPSANSIIPFNNFNNIANNLYLNPVLAKLLVR